jgi:diguanylate cyclase (GGDEF)-like protein/PAS domain S-box-containing protein
MFIKNDSILSVEKIIDHLDGSIICCKGDACLTIVYASGYFYKTLGYESGEVSSLLAGYPNSILQNEPPIDIEKLTEELRQNGFAEMELKLIKKDGHHIWACCRVRLLEENGETYFCGILFDVTLQRRSRRREYEQMQAIKKAESELAASEERYRLIMEEAADPIFDVDMLTHQVYCSPSFKSEFNLDIAMSEDFWNTVLSSDIIHPEDREKFLSRAHDLYGGRPQVPGEYRLMGAGGRYHWYRIRSTVIQNDGGIPIRVITFISDIDKQKQETIRLKKEAEHDLLTGLYNHVTTISLIEKAISNSKSGSRHALFVIDIDNFKNANDKLGHLFGDELLMEISSKLKSQFREDDIVGRMGGDEFVVFLQNIPSEAILEDKSRLLNGIFRSTRTNGGDVCRVSCSVGAAIYPTDGTSYPELFHKADIAMYAAKNSGKDACCIYSDKLEAAACPVGRTVK